MDTTLEHVNFTEKDFELIIEALEVLPKKFDATDLMTDLLAGLLVGNRKEDLDRLMREQKAKRDKQRNLTMLIEDIKILQGKVIQLKRFLIEQGALKEVNSILNK